MRKTRWHAFWKMSHPGLYVILLLSAGLCFLVSYANQCSDPWISSLHQSIGAGIITGIIVLVLGNVRSQVKERTERKIDQYSNLCEILSRLYHSIPDRSMVGLSQKKYDYAECTQQTIEAGKEYIRTIQKLDYPILKAFVTQTNIDIRETEKWMNEIADRDLPENMTLKDAYEIRAEIICIVQEAGVWFEDQLREAKIQKEQLWQYPF